MVMVTAGEMAIFRPLLVLSALGMVTAQNPGNGISKQTYAVTDPQAAFTWFAQYLPIHCSDPLPMCNSTDAQCGQKGRSNLCSESSTDTCEGSTFATFMFHMVNTSARPSGMLASVADVEAHFDEKMKAAFAAKKYDAFMDFSVAFAVSDMDIFLAKFKADSVPYLLLSWFDDKATPYYSLIIHGPHTQVVVELISATKPSSVPASEFIADSTLRYTSGIFLEMGVHLYPVARNRMRPLCVSKATSDMDAVTDFYEHALFATREWNVSYPDGTKYSYWNPGFASMAGKMQVRFVERPPSATTGKLTVALLEKIKFAGHAISADNAKNNSANTICGFDKWYDNHYAIDGGQASLSKYKAAFDARHWPYYQAWGGGQGPENLYVVDPTGDAIQLDSSWGSGGAPAGVTGDALGTMCSQGNCLAGQRLTPEACTAALTAACPGLDEKFSACSDCVYDNAHWPTLQTAGCLNADAVGYCIGT